MATLKSDARFLSFILFFEGREARHHARANVNPMLIRTYGLSNGLLPARKSGTITQAPKRQPGSGLESIQCYNLKRRVVGRLLVVHTFKSERCKSDRAVGNLRSFMQKAQRASMAKRKQLEPHNRDHIIPIDSTSSFGPVLLF